MLFLNIDEFESKDKIYVNKNVYSPLIKAHSHKFFEIIYIYNGTGKHVINGVSHDAARGSLFFLNYNVEHYFESASSSFSLLNCAFLPSAIDESLSYTENASDLLKLPMFEIYKKEKIDLSVSVNIHGLYKEFEDILFAMNDEYTEKNIGYQSILRQALNILLIRIFRRASGKSGERTYSKNKEIIGRALEYIDANYSKSLSVKEVADFSMLSSSYFTAVFKSVMGYSLFDYVQRVRISEACTLLKKTQKKIDVIMEDVGYNDLKFFYKAFRLYTDMTPGEYRKKYGA